MKEHRIAEPSCPKGSQIVLVSLPSLLVGAKQKGLVSADMSTEPMWVPTKYIQNHIGKK